MFFLCKFVVFHKKNIHTHNYLMQSSHAYLVVSLYYYMHISEITSKFRKSEIYKKWYWRLAQ